MSRFIDTEWSPSSQGANRISPTEYSLEPLKINVKLRKSLTNKSRILIQLGYALFGSPFVQTMHGGGILAGLPLESKGLGEIKDQHIDRSNYVHTHSNQRLKIQDQPHLASHMSAQSLSAFHSRPQHHVPDVTQLLGHVVRRLTSEGRRLLLVAFFSAPVAPSTTPRYSLEHLHQLVVALVQAELGPIQRSPSSVFAAEIE